MIKPARRIRGISYAIRDVVLPARKIEEKGEKVLHLNIGDPNKYDSGTPQHMKDALCEATNQGLNGYAPSEGYPELREAIIEREKNRNNVKYSKDGICVTTGVTESLQMLLDAMLDPNDEILIPGPTYPQYSLIAHINNAKPIPYRCQEEKDWQPDVDYIRKRLSNRTKGIVL
ncbi:MAG: aminotransferase class I/II-fold pyridoxal phosphate-dependent enzyme, partial [Candidatus Thermoplasmatota archaeon]